MIVREISPEGLEFFARELELDLQSATARIAELEREVKEFRQGPSTKSVAHNMPPVHIDATKQQ